jgi:hypothetical protein
MGTEALFIITEHEPHLPTNLFCFPMEGMFSAAAAEFFQLHAGRIIPAVFLTGVIAFFAFGTREGDHRTNIFFL